MTDQELLELAAKAAGVEPIQITNWFEDQEGNFVHGPCWNPLESDGDALRLAVTLELLIDTHGLHARVCYPYEAPLAYESMGQDRAAATRRAIVRAAAEIGRQCHEADR